MKLNCSRYLFLAILLTALAGVPQSGVAQGDPQTAAQSPAAAARRDPLHLFSESIQDLTAKVTRSVVQITATGYGLKSEKQASDTALFEPQEAIGAGVILSPDGYIVTNAHVVQGARKIRVRLPGLEVPGTSESMPHGPVSAKIIGLDHQSDLAVLKIDAKDLPALELADPDHLKQGQVVFAFGSPQGLENSVTMGVVSATARQVSDENPTTFIQTDAPINPGNSGGPLVDADGNVVGIDTFIYTKSGGNEGIGFAIPSGIARYAYEQIRQYGRVRRRTIGADLQTLTPDLAAGLGFGDLTGVIVADLDPDGPAEAAGLHVQDLIESIDGMPVENVALFTLSLYLRTTNDKVNLQIMRGTKQLSIAVPVIEPRHDVSRLAELSDPSKDLIPRLGIIGATITPQIAEILGGARRLSGVLVTATVANRLAVDSGLQEGDIIHSLNRTQVKSMEDLRTAFSQLKPGDPAAMQVERGGRLTYLTFEME